VCLRAVSFFASLILRVYYLDDETVRIFLPPTFDV
jgi:hypothetical protein